MRHKAITCTCLHCKAQFLEWPSRIAVGRGRYCSKACMYAGRRKSLTQRFDEGVDNTGDCWIWTGRKTRAGYGMLDCDGFRLAHRAAWFMANGPIPDGLWVLHRCDNPSCVRPEHLFLGTAHDNMQDMLSKGRAPTGDRSGARKHPERVARGDQSGARLHPETRARGERNGNRKLTEDAVRAIRASAAAGILQTDIAATFRIALGTVNCIVNRRTWKHIE